jgi:protein-S-isoprenylcysteine O-methyltransferase Ste14
MTQTGETSKGADVHVIPPAVYAVPFAATTLLHRVVPWTMPEVPGRRAAGVALVVAGQAVAAAGALTFRNHSTTIIPNQPVTTMVTSGVYAYTRNPMYVGMTSMYLGASLIVGSWWSPLVLPAVVAFVDRNVIRREEAYLRQRFGEAYEEFCRHTRRWI